jgi:hypothetical protein
MNNIEQYKNRFFNLMESTIGDVRPLITEQTNPNGSQSSELGNSPITNVEDLKGDDLKKFYNAMIATYEGNKTFEGMTIFSTLLNNREKNIDIKRLQDYINQSTGENYNLIDIYNKLSDKEALASKGANIKKR